MRYQQLFKYLVLGSLLSFNMAAFACTGVRVTAQDGSVVYGRTLEFGVIPSSIIVVPQGMQFQGTTKTNVQNGKKWTVKYAFTGVSPYNYPDVMDGINEKGLAVGTFLFPEYAKYPALTKDNQNMAVASYELGAYLLSQFATVDEVKQGLNQVTVVPVQVPQMQNMVMPLHFIVHDAQGNSLVIEYVDGKMKTYDNPLGVITNAPTFDWHLTNLDNYVNLHVNNVPPIQFTNGVTLQGFGQGSGLLGLPGDFTPPSRFVRAVVFSQSMMPVATGGDGVFQVFHILNQFDIPKGTIRDKQGNETLMDYTQWTSVSDLKNVKFYYRTYNDQSIRVVDLMKMDLKGKQIQNFPMDATTTIPLAIPATLNDTVVQ